VGFETPLMLLGLLGVAAPVAAHLMRRRDLPIIALPTVALLSRAQARSRRRMHLVDLLLLISRIALVAALAFAVSDPYVTVRLSYGDGRVASVAIVLDDSMSMERSADDRGSGPPLSTEARDIAAGAIASLPEGSEVSVILAGAPVRLLVPRTRDLEGAADALSEVKPSARGTDMPGGIARATRELAAARVDTRRLLVITDGAEHAHLSDVRWPDDDIGVEVRRLEGGHANRTIASAHAVPDPTTPGQASIAVEVRAFGGANDATVVLSRGDDELAREEVDLSSGTGRITLHAPLVEEGDPGALLSLEGRDALAMDDERAVLLRPPSALRVLLVDGDPQSNRDRDEVGNLSRALDLAPADAGLITYRVVDPDTAEALDLGSWDVVVLANVRVPPVHAAERLVRFVELGGGLLVTAGDRVDPAAYQARLGAVLPARPRAVGSAPSPLGIRRNEQADADLPSGVGLDSVAVTRRMVLEPAPEATVVLGFDDSTPALVVGERDAGRAALMAIPVDTGWSDLPYRPGFLPLMVELLGHLGPRTRLPHDAVAPGSTVAIPAPTSGPAVVLAPDGERYEGPASEPFELSETDVPGAYRILSSADGADGAAGPRGAFVVAPIAEESDLADAADDGFDVSSEGEHPESGGAVVRRSIAPWLFLLAGILAVLEAILRSRRPLRAA